jgi:hypothetical protein
MARLNTGLDKKYMIVSGSNIPEVNGIYQRAGIENGKPLYIKTPAVNAPIPNPPPFPVFYGNLKISIQGMFPIRWVLSHVSYVGDFYSGSSDFATPDLVPSWSIGQNGSGGISVKVFSGRISIKKQNLGGGKISLFFDTLPLNTQSIKLNLGYTIGGCGNDFVLMQNGVWSQNGCDFYVRWDNKDGTLPYKWRFFYSSDGRTDYASHPTAGPDGLPKKGWSNGMTISENQLITFGQSLVLNNLQSDPDANCSFSFLNRTWIYLGAPSFRYRPIDNLSYHINTPLTPDGYGGNGSYNMRSSDEVYFTNSYNNSDKFPSNNWQLAAYINNVCPQITTAPIFSLL